MLSFAECAANELGQFADLAQNSGAASVELYTGADSDQSLVIIESAREIGDNSVFPVRELFSGGSFGTAGGNHLFKVGLWVPAESRAEFLAWYESEHLPILLECADWTGCRFIEKPVEEGHQFYALHQLGNVSALDSQERQRSRATPWFMRLKQHPWFDGAFTRQLYNRAEA